MKKIGIFLICVLLAVALAVPAFAAGNTVFNVTANKSSVAKGEEVTFTVSISGENGLKTFGVAMDYDDDKFELVSHSPIITEWTAVYQPAVKMYAFMNMSSPPGAPAPVPSGKLFTFTLKAKANCGTAAVSVAPTIKVSGITDEMIEVKDATINFAGEHAYGDWEPNGDKNHVRTCSACGAKDTAPHDWKDGTVIKQPNCAEEGQMNQSCACGATKVASIEKNDAHDYDQGKITTEPGCETEGVKTYTCKNGCGVPKTEKVPATGHDYDEGKITTEPGCETEGVKTYTCKNGCGVPKTEKVPATGHDYDEGKITTEPGCETEGVKTYTCKNGCGKPKTEKIAATGHDYDEGKITTEPGCETEGVKTYTCKNNCGVPKTEKVPATGHDYDEGKITTEPTCETEGVKTYTCKNGCGKPKTEKVPATGHDYDEGKITTEPTCETEGVKTYTCKNGCGKPKTEKVPALGHTPAEDAVVTKKPTCEETGVMTGKCGVCGADLEDYQIPALGHDYELTVTVDPDCENDGYKTYVCKNDASHTYNDPIPALGHSWGAWTKVDDAKHQRVCGTCGDVETADHNWNSGFETKAPTCAEAGEKLFTCTDNCGAEYTEVIPATGIHDYDEYKDNLDDKTHTATCVCGDSVVEDHDYCVNGDVLVKPTTSKEGQQEMLCACGAKTIKTLPKLKDENKGELDDVSKTGDITGQIVVFAVATAATMTAAGYGLKRKFTK